ncbi:DUF4124 domain-containing protein [Alishewanella jeotgali]|uniref:DUF4124 domain-containing protein n=1 Tax=Alishewanella jeotgali KCTC 22429 TaxID=1129374 RepID=H3ZIE0_9ALTE|nr:DUF4124 domain-containing protein [Alishewanella jeotgali]EHR39590.1 hypothetical protein AJE_15754 [Alishewanella jeotgali KCTC 22429]
MRKLLIFSALFFPVCVNAQVYKCEVDGVVTYSQQPCADNAELTQYSTENSVQSDPPQANDSATQTARPTQPAANHEAELARINESIRKRNINTEITRLTAERNRKMRERDQKMAQLRRTKQSAANNLAGATWEESLSKEMSAVAMQYDTDIRSLDNRIDRLREDLKRD